MSRDFDDYFAESQASRGNYLWKYHDRHGRPKLTHNPDTVEFERDVFGHEYTIISFDTAEKAEQEDEQ